MRGASAFVRSRHSIPALARRDRLARRGSARLWRGAGDTGRNSSSRFREPATAAVVLHNRWRFQTLRNFARLAPHFRFVDLPSSTAPHLWRWSKLHRSDSLVRCRCTRLHPWPSIFRVCAVGSMAGDRSFTRCHALIHPSSIINATMARPACRIAHRCIAFLAARSGPVHHRVDFCPSDRAAFCPQRFCFAKELETRVALLAGRHRRRPYPFDHGVVEDRGTA